MKKYFLLLATITLSLFVKAEIVLVDGICYDVITKTKTAEVVSLSRTGSIFYDENLDFYYSYYVGDIVIPSTIEYNGITYNVTSIGEGAFAAIDIPDYGNPRYGTNYLLKSVTISSGVTSIGDQAFYQCTNLNSVNIPDGVKYIGESAFNGCKSITSITLPEGLTEIPGGLFAGCTNLSLVNIPSSVKVICSMAFAGLKKLTNVSMHEGLKKIEAYAFYLSGLTSVYIPNSVTYIGQEAFRECYNLSTLHLPDSLEKIETAAFWYDRSLTTVIIPNNVKEIGSLAFRECDKLKTVIIGSGVKTIWDSFSYCRELTDVYCYADSVPQTYEKAFEYSMIEYATLHVPEGSLEAYKSANVWKDFKNIVALREESAETQKCEAPIIYYENGQIHYTCNTDDVHFITNIVDHDITTHYTQDIMLKATYNISVYAEKYGYENSDVVYATLCWIDSSPTTEGVTNSVATVRATPVLIQNSGSLLIIKGADDGTQISVYDMNGKLLGSQVSQNRTATINTSLQSGSVAIIKIGQKSIKTVIK